MVSVELSEVLSVVICTNADWFSILHSNHHLTTPLLHTLHLYIKN